MRLTSLLAGLVAALALAWAGSASAQLRGHGGPVRGVAVTADGALAISGGFDSTAIVWAIGQGRALSVLRVHDGAVNAVATLPDGRFATAGEDGRVALWRLGRPEPERVLTVHEGPIAGIAVAPDGTAIATASWDGTARITPLGEGEPVVLRGHQGNVNGVAFAPDGRTLYTAGYDATLRAWGRGGEALRTVTLPTPLNAVAVAGSVVAVGGADGQVRLVRPDGVVAAEGEPIGAPIVSLAASPGGDRVAAAGARGAVVVADARTGKPLATLVGPGLPVWSVVFHPDGERLVTGGGDRLVRQWNARNGEPVGAFVVAAPGNGLEAFGDDRGAQVFRACVACHALRPEDGERAGPSLHGLMGRRIASVPGYNYSPALRALDIVWTPETVAKLFEVGPATYTPGTKMPEQTVGSAEDREALVRFLERVTRP
ncbi:c-type cytochrome [Alsobacter sp. R-9]